jgi:hypothetical protein
VRSRTGEVRGRSGHAAAVEVNEARWSRDIAQALAGVLRPPRCLARGPSVRPRAGVAHALSSIAAALRERGLLANAIYVSNVEQYLFAGDAFAKWTKNVSLLPMNGKGLILRAYLDQGSTRWKWTLTGR